MSHASKRPSRSLAFLLVAAVGSSACALPYRQIPASGVVHGQPVETHVDSELAAYYLAHFDDWRQEGSEHARALAELPLCSSASLEREALRRLALRTSIDVASLYTADCLMKANRNLGVEFSRVFSRIQAFAQPAIAKPKGMLDEATDYAVVVVPGWDYVESGAITGADFARQLRQFSELGIPNYRVPIDPAGGVEENAAVIGSELVRIGLIHENIVLVSASSGSPAAAHALGDPAVDVRHVRAWLNLGGILGGMRLIDQYSEGFGSVALRVFAWLNGWDMDDIQSMSAARSHERIANLRIPEHVVVINYVGIPFSGDISSRVSFFYSRLREHGPNDGLTLIADPILPGTHTIVALGQDHFFADDPELESRTLALTSVIARVASRRGDALEVAEAADESSPRLARIAAPSTAKPRPGPSLSPVRTPARSLLQAPLLGPGHQP